MNYLTSKDVAARMDDHYSRVQRFGDVPSNPFTELREAAHLSIETLAKQAIIDPAALIRSEQGLYTNPLPSLVQYWVRLGKTSEGVLINAYDDFQDLQRARHRYYFGHHLSVNLNDEHPFRQLRKKRPSLSSQLPLPVGVVEVAKALCVPLDTIQFFEKRFQTQQSVPKTIKAVLNQIGYTPEQIAKFEDSYKQWRALNVKQVTFSG